MNFTKKIAVLSTVVATLGIASVASAAWLGSGDGTGSAKASRLAVSTIASSDPTSTLFPGGSAGAVTVKVHNSNSGSIVVTGIATRVGVSSAAITGCTTPDVRFTAPTSLAFQLANTLVSRTIAAGGDQEFTLAGSVAMGLSSSDDCQGRTLTVPVIVSATTPAP